MVVIIAGLFAFQYKRENAQSILRASYGEELSNFTIELKENGNYIIINSGIFDTKYSYGKFISKDSIITLDKSSDLLYLKTNKFVVREKMLLPISSDGIVTYNGLFIDYDYRN
ncbi:MAG: hypothetical protein H7321_00225 [Bacteroidia bacterium]|nr:hypothetical protein [Bacteroidia bacterium]